MKKLYPLTASLPPLAVVLCFLSQIASATESIRTDDDRLIGFTTQDANGFHIITISSRNELAAVVLINPEGGKEDRRLSYSNERFDSMWQKIQKMELTAFEIKGDNDSLGPAYNYIVSIRSGNLRRVYSFPKCTTPDSINSFIYNLVHGLLPEGSPGLFKPCDTP